VIPVQKRSTMRPTASPGTPTTDRPSRGRCRNKRKTGSIRFPLLRTTNRINPAAGRCNARITAISGDAGVGFSQKIRTVVGSRVFMRAHFSRRSRRNRPALAFGRQLAAIFGDGLRRFPRKAGSRNRVPEQGIPAFSPSSGQMLLIPLFMLYRKPRANSLPPRPSHPGKKETRMAPKRGCSGACFASRCNLSICSIIFLHFQTEKKIGARKSGSCQGVEY